MFQKDFLWGAASAAYQVEGAYTEDGKGLGIWDVMTEEPGRVKNQETGKVACDHYHKMQEDVALMKKIGLKSYRFSISWSRILPDGIGKVNENGIRFYLNLVDELLNAQIEPIVTLYHWNLPYALYLKGGWKNPDSPLWFAEYVKIVTNALSDKVKYWITFNEPQVFVGLGYKDGIHAPFERNDTATLTQISKNILLAHGKAVSILRQYGKQPLLIGMAPTGPVLVPGSNSPDEEKAAREASFAITKDDFIGSNSWWADPVFLRKFPAGAENVLGKAMISFTEEQWDEISQPLDFYGFNVYQSISDGTVRSGEALTAMGGRVTPEVMYWAPKFFYERYRKPVLITENGMANVDWASVDEKVHDPQRIDFMTRYLRFLKKATDEQIPVLGYHYWSVMDNFEWAEGYGPRFGLIYVDYETQKRTLKDSALWYSQIIESNGGLLG